MNSITKNLKILIISGALIQMQPVYGQGSDYTNRNYTLSPCELFARDAHQAAEKFGNKTDLHKLLNLIDSSPVSANEKHRIFQAIQFVWSNQLDNPTLAYTLAMGLCLKPKQTMAPMDEPWVTSPRTSREFY